MRTCSPWISHAWNARADAIGLTSVTLWSVISSLRTELIATCDPLLIRSRPPIKRNSSLATFTWQDPTLLDPLNCVPLRQWRFNPFQTVLKSWALVPNSPPSAMRWFPLTKVVCQRGMLLLGDFSVENFIPRRPLRGWWTLLYLNDPNDPNDSSFLSPRRTSCSSKRSTDWPIPPKFWNSTIFLLHFLSSLKTSTSPEDENNNATAGAHLKVLGAWNRLKQEENRQKNNWLRSKFTKYTL